MAARRPWLQFSLRGLFILLTVACLWLGRKVEQVSRQRAVVALVSRHSGSVEFDYQASWPRRTPPGPKILRGILGDDFFARLIRISAADIGDEDLRRICAFDTLTTLDVSGERLTDDGFKYIARLKQLRSLSVWSSNASDKSLKALGELTNLEVLRLPRSKITGKGLGDLHRLSKLRCLDLKHTLVGDNGIKSLTQLRRLESIELGGSLVTQSGMNELLRTFSRSPVGP